MNLQKRLKKILSILSLICYNNNLTIVTSLFHLPRVQLLAKKLNFPEHVEFIGAENIFGNENSDTFQNVYEINDWSKIKRENFEDFIISTYDNK